MKTDLFPEDPILIVDDEESVIKGLTTSLRSNGINNLVSCSDSRDVMGIVNSTELEVILLDLSMPNISGNELLSEIHGSYPQIPVIVITGTNEVKAAVDCMKTGAFDYMVKAVEENRLVSGVKRAIEIRKLKREYSDLKEKFIADKINNPRAFSHILTQNKRMQTIFLLVESIAKSNEPVLIIGETGAGKNLIAKAVHDVSGREGPFVDINVAGLDDTMFADTLFGHKKGAFTGAVEPRNGLVHQAKSGTLFLDEIGDLTLPSQVKLLRLLDTREYYPLGSDLAKRTDARIVVATNRDLDKRIESEKFRKDLYYRLSTHEIKIPPLRERKEDLPLLLGHFLGEAALKLGRKKPAVPQELLPLLDTYNFPGNIRELRSIVFDAVTKQASKTLSLAPFKEAIGIGSQRVPLKQTEKLLEFTDNLPTIKQSVELLIAEALKRARGNQSLAAGLLGISPQALNKRLLNKHKE
ncbi:MAG TPA: sigma-54-dependent Fis family transcriptional regulator [Spirochaetes bacterium]|nr:sigma-54-dependent Fis family transcriptional regulator [Spirochaetota bacterium]